MSTASNWARRSAKATDGLASAPGGSERTEFRSASGAEEDSELNEFRSTRVPSRSSMPIFSKAAISASKYLRRKLGGGEFGGAAARRGAPGRRRSCRHGRAGPERRPRKGRRARADDRHVPPAGRLARRHVGIAGGQVGVGRPLLQAANGHRAVGRGVPAPLFARLGANPPQHGRQGDAGA